MPGEASFLSRFTLKFVEVVAAGVATAVSGYIVAHLSGYFPASVPAALHAPAQTAAPRLNAANPHAEPATPVAVDADTLRLVPKPDLKSAAVPPARSAADLGPAVPTRKPMAAESGTAESKPHDAVEAKSRDLPEPKPHDAVEAKAHDTPEAKPRGGESLEAQVRAALAKGDAARPAPDQASRQAAVPAEPPHAPPAVEPLSRPAEPATATIAVTPRTADAVPQQAPVLAAPPAAIEIKSLPVAGVDDAAPPAPQAQAEAEPTGTDLFAALKRIPDLLRSDTPLPADQAPRPPMPVGH